MKRLVILAILLAQMLIAASPVGIAVTVVGSVFSLELQDANRFPVAGEMDLGRYEPGTFDFPVQGVLVAACKSNLGTQWTLQVEAPDPLTNASTGQSLASGALKVRGLSPTKSPDGNRLPGNLITVEQAVTVKPIIAYTSDNRGDIGFNNYEGTYVPLGFGANIPKAQPQGTYTGRILITMTE